MRHSNAAVSISGSTIVGSGSASITSSANTDASLHAVSVDGIVGSFAIAFAESEAESDATTTLDGTSVVAAGAVDVTSSATTKAYVKARTAAGLLGTNETALAVAVALGETTETSHVTVSDTSTVKSTGSSVNIDASGSSYTFPWSQPTIYNDGSVAIGLAAGFDNADIKAIVNGTVSAKGGISGSFSALAGDHQIDYTSDIITIPNHGYHRWRGSDLRVWKRQRRRRP